MFGWSKKKPDSDAEIIAAGKFVQLVIERADKSWPEVKALLSATHPECAGIDDQTGRFDFVLAGLTMHGTAVRNLFAKDQADRLEAHILRVIDTPQYGEYAVREVRAYGQAMAKEQGNDPRDAFAAVAVRLLHRLLGDQMKSTVGPGGIVSPLLVMAAMAAVTDLGGMYWRNVKDSGALA